MLSHLNILAIFIALNVTGLADDTKKDNKKIYSGKKLKALLITGGCCHNYIFQSTALTSGIEEKVNVEFIVIYIFRVKPPINTIAVSSPPFMILM